MYSNVFRCLSTASVSRSQVIIPDIHQDVGRLRIASEEWGTTSPAASPSCFDVEGLRQRVARLYFKNPVYDMRWKYAAVLIHSSHFFYCDSHILKVSEAPVSPIFASSMYNTSRQFFFKFPHCTNSSDVNRNGNL